MIEKNKASTQTTATNSSFHKRLSEDIRKEYPGIQGFSVSNIWNMRMFYSETQANTNLQPLVAEISWTKNIIILTK